MSAFTRTYTVHHIHHNQRSHKRAQRSFNTRARTLHAERHRSPVPFCECGKRPEFTRPNSVQLRKELLGTGKCGRSGEQQHSTRCVKQRHQPLRSLRLRVLEVVRLIHNHALEFLCQEPNLEPSLHRQGRGRGGALSGFRSYCMPEGTTLTKQGRKRFTWAASPYVTTVMGLESSAMSVPDRMSPTSIGPSTYHRVSTDSEWFGGSTRITTA
jgi:hypothetical protein